MLRLDFASLVPFPFHRLYLLLQISNIALYFSNIYFFFKGESGDDGLVGPAGREVM